MRMVGRLEYETGCSGTGVAMTAYPRRALDRKILSHYGGDTELSLVPFDTKPFFRSQMWYRRPLLAMHDVHDQFPSSEVGLG